MVPSLVSGLNYDTLRISHPTPCTIVQPVTGDDVLWYVVFRFVMASYMIGSFVSGVVAARIDMMDNMASLHFPVWGYSTAIIQSVLLAYATLRNYYSVHKSVSGTEAKHKEHNSRHRDKRKTSFNVTITKMPKIYIIIWVAYYIMLYSSLMTLIMYQTGLFKGRLYDVTPSPNSTPTPTQIMIHQIFFVYCFIDFCVCDIPVRILHVYVMITFAIVYQLTILIVTITFSETIDNYLPLYDVADIQAHRRTICYVYFIGFSFVTPVAVHIIYYGLFLLKSYLVELYFRTTLAMKKPKPMATTVPDEKKTPAAGGGGVGVGGGGVPEWSSGGLRPTKIQPISEQEEAEIKSLNAKDSDSERSIVVIDYS